MHWETTSPTLLQRLRDRADQVAWREFDRRYGELIVRYARSQGLQLADAEDVRQVVLTSLSKAMPGFEYSRERGRFRHYLGRVVRNAVIRWRPNGRESALQEGSGADPAAEPVEDPQWDREWVRHHYRLAMESVRASFDPRSIAIFDRLLAGVDVGVVSSEFGVSTQAVHKVKQRIRDRLAELIAAQVRREEGDVESSSNA